MVRLLLLLLSLCAPLAAHASSGETPQERVYNAAPPAPRGQSWAEANSKSTGCQTCHTATDHRTMHESDLVVLGCTDCHGGDPAVQRDTALPESAAAYDDLKNLAHVLPLYPQGWHWPNASNPVRSYTLLNREAPEYIRFVNPSDYRVARQACGACHEPIFAAAERSLMATGSMLWSGAAYNNGILPFKNYLLGESYTPDGKAAAIASPPPVTEAMQSRGILKELFPLPAFQTLPPADIFRVFERGGRNIVTQFAEVGLPNAAGQLQRLEEPGRPDIRQSNRGPGTGLRVAVPVINIHKTRLNDPFTWFMGTNDQPGDYRSSGCASCHVVYANDRDPRHSAIYAPYGHDGTSQSKDPTIAKNVPGHPLTHGFTRAIPTSQCMICHMHQPNMFMNTFLGYTMWDYEADAPFFWPTEEKNPTSDEAREALDRNPEEAVIRGKWADLDFLKSVWDSNPKFKDTQFADYHGHGWNFRAVFKRDRHGNLLTADGTRIDPNDPNKWKKAVHMSSVHVDKGMQCVDCHFAQDAHGNGYIHGEVAAAVEIRCQDCHGTAKAYPSLLTSGPAAPPGGHDLTLIRNPDGKPRFEWVGKKLIQRSAVTPGLEWEMSLVKDTVDPKNPHFNAKAARAKTISNDGTERWGPGIAPQNFAHKDSEMACFTCHTSWTTSCAGCHLPIQANWKTDSHHFEGGETRNYATYNPQINRDDIFMLGKHGSVKDGIIAPVRSSSALILSSQNVNRERIYIQQTPISAAGFSSQAFAPHYPHTERKTETKSCTDCHLSADGDNNAIMGQLLGLGTHLTDFIGHNAWVGGDGGFEAVTVTEFDEPQAVIGSYLHRYAYPARYKAHQDRGKELPQTESQTEAGAKTGCLQLQGEYLFAAEAENGTQIYDVASIANKGVADRIITAPFSPLGQDTHIPSKNATCVVLPSVQNVHPARNQGDLMRKDNQEQPMHPLYKYAFITDAEEGLILVDTETLKDGEPRNNFLTRALTWNERGILKGARHLAIAGTTLYVSADAGIIVLNLDDPLKPRYLATIPANAPRASMVQFRYLFFTDADGFKVVDVTHPDNPRPIEKATLRFKDAHGLFLVRTYAYVAAGPEGLAIIDIEKPEAPRLDQTFTADGAIKDARDVAVGGAYASAFAYLADGVAGLKVIQLFSPETQPNFYGFSPEPKPQLIATRQTNWPALSISRGIERDRSVDESGHQVAIFGRLGSRPFTREEMEKLYLNKKGGIWTVKDTPDRKKLVP